MSKFWLLKAEPDSRIVKGKDVKFSVDDFEAAKASPWEGVRNYEARNLMKEMKIGDKALFYHSNCKNPGIAGFAEVRSTAFYIVDVPSYRIITRYLKRRIQIVSIASPFSALDFAEAVHSSADTAWDESHPYYDASAQETNRNPAKPLRNGSWSTWLSFPAPQHFVPLSLLRLIASYSSNNDLPESLSYIGDDGIRAIKNMDLVTRGRLSVQRVDQKAWNTIHLLAEKGGWDELALDPKKTPSTSTKGRGKASSSTEVNGTPKAAAPKRTVSTRAKATPKKAKAKTVDEDEDEDGYQTEPSSEDEYSASDDASDYGKSKGKASKAKSKGKKRKSRGAKDDDDDDGEYTGRSPRRRKKT
ncbi:hypothetical protein VNI00_013404 [Paramarasmius palmivorus]|uniref:EVE domain-containing protein n=1 Tax=Paramarasmius palmivorus TaxID=297713 RepID=A0AAW0C1H3_9AGAR